MTGVMSEDIAPSDDSCHVPQVRGRRMVASCINARPGIL